MRRLSPERTQELVLAAADGDAAAWEAVVDAYVGLVWAIARNHRLSTSDAADVTQTVWLRLLENIGRLEDPTRIGAWLATTTRRECLRLLGVGRRQVLLGDVIDLDVDSSALVEADEELLSAGRGAEMQRALAQLPARCQQLLALLTLDPPLSYEEIAAALDRPVGSIGPTRGRCLRRLHHLLLAPGTGSDGGSIISG